MRKPTVRRGVELPEFADLRALPTAHGGQNFFGRDGMGELVIDGPAADLGAVEFEVEEAEYFGSGEALRTGRRAGQAFFEEVQDKLTTQLVLLCSPRDSLRLGSGVGALILQDFFVFACRTFAKAFNSPEVE